MFSNGQWIFGILFALVFVMVLIYTYRKDLKLHKNYYKGSLWVLLIFVSMLLILVSIKFFS